MNRPKTRRFLLAVSMVIWSVGLMAPALSASADLEILGSAETRAVESLDDAWRATRARSKPHWVGWRVPALRHGSSRGTCRVVLGDGHQGWQIGRDEPLAPPADSLLLLEVREGRLAQLEVSESRCVVDARGVELEWWDGVSTAESYAFVDSVLLADEHEEVREDGAAALAIHPDRRVDARLRTLALEDASEDVRHAAIFWLAEARGADGYTTLLDLEPHLSSSDLSEALVFAYHVSRESAATDRLLLLAQGHSDSEVREQALFWVAQEASDRATEALRRAVDRDPESEVRQAAVFGLTQLPPERGIPILLRIARTHSDPEVVEDALFWLGESGDPRALELFDEILGDS